MAVGGVVYAYAYFSVARHVGVKHCDVRGWRIMHRSGVMHACSGLVVAVINKHLCGDLGSAVSARRASAVRACCTIV